MYVVNVAGKINAVVALVLEHVIGSGAVKTTSKCCFYEQSPRRSASKESFQLTAARRITMRRGRRPRH